MFLHRVVSHRPCRKSQTLPQKKGAGAGGCWVAEFVWTVFQKLWRSFCRTSINKCEFFLSGKKIGIKTFYYSLRRIHSVLAHFTPLRVWSKCHWQGPALPSWDSHEDNAPVKISQLSHWISTHIFQKLWQNDQKDHPQSKYASHQKQDFFDQPVSKSWLAMLQGVGGGGWWSFHLCFQTDCSLTEMS